MVNLEFTAFRFKTITRRPLLAAVLTGLCASTFAAAQRPADNTLPAPAALASPARQASPERIEQETATPSKPGSEGIKVHGHWKIVVKNPDGTVATTSEFENSLITSAGNTGGDTFLVGLLAGETTATLDWNVQWAYTGGGCTQAFCTQTSYAPSMQLFASTPTSPAKFQLTANVPAPSALSIIAVYTNPIGCYTLSPPLSTSSAQCNEGGTLPYGVSAGNWIFTGTSLPTPVAVVAGQVVIFTVTISFS